MARNPRKTIVTFQLEDDVLSQVDRLAHEQIRTRSGCLRWLLLRSLARIQQEASTSLPAAEAPRLETSATA